MNPVRIGISACLLGKAVRYDGGHKHDGFLTETVGKLVDFVPVCPELEIGLGVPREAIHLVADGKGRRLLGVKTRADHTGAMARYAAEKIVDLQRQNLSGFILKKDSPSCGMERVRIYDADGNLIAKNGRGAFAQVLMEGLPGLPVEEEGRLQDPALRERFFEAVFAYRRLRDFSTRWTVGGLVAFHSREKLMLMAHEPAAYSRLGRLVAGAKGADREDLAAEYSADFLGAIAKIATIRRHANVLDHIAGYFKKTLDSVEKAELHETIGDYRQGLVPLVVPITLLRHHIKRQRVDYLANQTYLFSHPKELMLRNHV